MNISTRVFIKTIFFGLVLSVISTACGQSKADKIDKLLSTYSEYGQFNGTVLVAENGEVIYKKGFGLANMEWGIPNKPDTKFRLASITKQFTSMLIMQLVAENKLRLDVPISTYLPDYPKKTSDVVTIHHLLSHTSGIPNYTDFYSFRDKMGDSHRPEQLVKIFTDSSLEFTPGERFQYSNSGYVLLGYIIEKITGKPYGEVLQNKIFGPLNMINSGYYTNNAVVKNKAAGYEKLGNKYENAAYLDMSFPFSAGGIYSTVEDLYLWDQALYTDKLLPNIYRDQLFKKHISTGGETYYAYGWELGNLYVGNTNEQVETINHSGGINGFNTLITRIPTDKILIVLLNNTGGAPLDEMTRSINGILHNKPYNLPKKSITNSLLAVLEKDGINAALSYYKSIKDSPDYRLNEGEINMAGYQLMQSHKIKEAVALFKLNIEAFPNSYNTYDSYAEALLISGDTTGSIENYKKSVELNIGNTNAILKLKDLGVNTENYVKTIPQEDLMLLQGEYLVSNPPSEKDKNWKIIFKVENGELKGNDRGYKYRLVPVSDNKFINPDDGASLVFDTKDKKAISLLLFDRFRFNKQN